MDFRVTTCEDWSRMRISDFMDTGDVFRWLPLPTSSSFLLRSEQWVFFWCLLIWSKTVPETGTTSRLPLMRFHSRSWPWSRKKPLTMANPPRSWNPHATKVEGIQQHLWLWEHEPEGRVRLDAFGFSSVAQSSFFHFNLTLILFVYYSAVGHPRTFLFSIMFSIVREMVQICPNWNCCLATVSCIHFCW